MITIDDITLPVIASTICKNASTLHMWRLDNSSAKEPISTQYANKCATQMLDPIKSRSPVNCQRQMQASQCRLSKKLLQQLINESPFDGTLDDWKKLNRSSFNKGREHLTIAKLPRTENTCNTLIKLRGCVVNWGYWSNNKRLIASPSFKVLIKITPYAL
jgi:hypothetical protein